MFPWCGVPKMRQLDWYCPADTKINDKTPVMVVRYYIVIDDYDVCRLCSTIVLESFVLTIQLIEHSTILVWHSLAMIVIGIFASMCTPEKRVPKANYCRLRFQMSSMVSLLLEKEDPNKSLPYMRDTFRNSLPIYLGHIHKVDQYFLFSWFQLG